MPSDKKSIGKVIKRFKKILNNTSELLTDTAKEILKLSDSLDSLENDLIKSGTIEEEVEVTGGTSIESPEKVSEKITLIKKGPPTRIEAKAKEENIEIETPIKKGPPTRITKEVESSLPKPPIIEKAEASPIRKSLDQIKGGISDLLLRLKKGLSHSLDTTSTEELTEEKDSLGSIKNKISTLYDKFRGIAEKEEDFYEMSPEQRKKALTDMAEAINILTDEYNKSFKPDEDQ